MSTSTSPLLRVLEAYGSASRYVYDGELESQTYQIFDANKKRVAFGDIYPAHADLEKVPKHAPLGMLGAIF